MNVFIKFEDGKVGDIRSVDIDTALSLIKQAKLGKDISKEFTLITSNGENIKTNHDQIVSVEIVF
jgi:hypothetical protein